MWAISSSMCHWTLFFALFDPYLYLFQRNLFQRNGAAKDFDFKEKKSIWKKNRGSSRVEGSALQLGMIPYFFGPPRNPILCPLF